MTSTGSGYAKEDSLRLAADLGLRVPRTVTIGPGSGPVDWLPPDDRPVFARVIVAGAVVQRLYLPPGDWASRYAPIAAAIARSSGAVAIVQENLRLQSSVVVASRNRWTYAEWNPGIPSSILVDGEIDGAVLLRGGKRLAVSGIMSQGVSSALVQIDDRVRAVGRPLLTEAAIDESGIVVLEAKPLSERLLPELGAELRLPSIARAPSSRQCTPISLELPALRHYEACRRSGDATFTRGALLSHLGTYSDHGGYGLRRDRTLEAPGPDARGTRRR